MTFLQKQDINHAKGAIKTNNELNQSYPFH
jgi:hypothetical protein